MGCMIHPKLRVPGITGNSGSPELPSPPGYRSHNKLRYHGFTRSTRSSRTKAEDSGFPESLGTLGSRRHPDLRVLIVTLTPLRFPKPPRTPSSLSHRELRVPVVARNSEFSDSPSNPGSGFARKAVFPDPARTAVFQIHQELQIFLVNRNSGFS